MTEKKLSHNLKELRLFLRLSQPEMGKRLGIGEKMYQLYESGKYDTVKTETVKRKKFLDKIEELKNSAENVQVKAGETTDFQKEIYRLNSIIDDKNKIIEAQQKALMMAERFINSITKKVAHGTSPTKNKN